MPKNSYETQIRDWERLLEAVQEGEAGLAGAASLSAALQSACAKAVRIRKHRDELHAASQEETRALHRALEECREAGISLRSYIKSVLGSRAEALVRYGVTPRRKRRPCRQRSEPAAAGGRPAAPLRHDRYLR